MTGSADNDEVVRPARQCPQIEMCDRDVVGEVPNHADRGVWVDDLEKAALPQLFAIAEMRGKRLKSSRRQPFRVIVGLTSSNPLFSPHAI